MVRHVVEVEPLRAEGGPIRAGLADKRPLVEHAEACLRSEATPDVIEAIEDPVRACMPALPLRLVVTRTAGGLVPYRRLRHDNDFCSGKLSPGEGKKPSHARFVRIRDGLRKLGKSAA